MALALLALALLAPAAAAAPGAFSKLTPANGATGVPAGPVTLTWQASSGATSYEYCYNTWAYCGVWRARRPPPRPPSRSGGHDHVWQIRAVNAAGTTYANDATWWTFTTAPMDAPGTFNKTKPLSGVMIDSPTAVTMMWEASKGATTYRSCYNTSAYCGIGEHDGDQPQRVGPDGGDDLLLAHPGRQPGRHDVFERRVVDLHHLRGAAGGLLQAGPLNGTTLTTPTSATLSWGTSARATSYEDCYDTSNDAACSSTWVGTGATTNAALSGLTAGTTYYWQVRATNPNPSETYADGGWWTFTTRVAPPGAFAKTGPLNLSPTPPDSATLTWEASSGATSYEFCIDTTNGSTCNGIEVWPSTGLGRSAALTGSRRERRISGRSWRGTPAEPPTPTAGGGGSPHEFRRRARS